MSMSWLNKYIRGLRFAFLGLLVVAVMGPWTFDLIVVPAKYSCSLPFVRLQGDFCGLPMSGIWILTGVTAELFNRFRGLFLEATANTDLRSLVLLTIIPIIILLPILSTMLVYKREDRLRRQVFQLVVWGMAAGAGVFFGSQNGPRIYWELWGTWLYIGLALAALIVEVVMLFVRRKTTPELIL